RSKQWRGALLGLVVTSLLLGALVSPSMAQGARASRGRYGYAPGYRRGYPGGMGLLPATLLRTEGGILPWRQLLWRRPLRPALGLPVFQRLSPRLRGLLRLQLLR